MPPEVTFASKERVESLSVEALRRVEQWLMADREPELSRWLSANGSVAEIASLALDGPNVSFFDGVLRRIGRHPVDRVARLALEDARKAHGLVLLSLDRTLREAEWVNGDEPTSALKAGLQGYLRLLVAGQDLRGPSRAHVLASLDEMFFEARRRGQEEILMRALARDLVNKVFLASDGRLGRLDVIEVLDVASRHMPAPERILCQELCSMQARATKPLPEDWLAREQPGVFSVAAEIGSVVVVSWHETDAPHDLSRDPFLGPAAEAYRLGEEAPVSVEWAWRGTRLGDLGTPHELVLERFADAHPRDFAAAVSRHMERIDAWIETSPERARQELQKLWELANRLPTEQASQILPMLRGQGIEDHSPAGPRL